MGSTPLTWGLIATATVSFLSFSLMVFSIVKNIQDQKKRSEEKQEETKEEGIKIGAEQEKQKKIRNDLDHAFERIRGIEGTCNMRENESIREKTESSAVFKSIIESLKRLEEGMINMDKKLESVSTKVVELETIVKSKEGTK